MPFRITSSSDSGHVEASLPSCSIQQELIKSLDCSLLKTLYHIVKNFISILHVVIQISDMG